MFSWIAVVLFWFLMGHGLIAQEIHPGTGAILLSETGTGSDTEHRLEDGSEEETNSDTASGTIVIPEIERPLVRITEVLADPVGPEEGQWIEVGNLGNIVVSLVGWSLEVGNTDKKFMLNLSHEEALNPKSFLLFRRSETSLLLRHDGGLIRLWSGSILIDTLEYPETAEGVSFGREAGNPSGLRPFCVPTGGEENTLLEISPGIRIQSGVTSAEEKLSINLEAVLPGGSLEAVTCHWTYGDGFTSESCNPPSHTFTLPGTYEVILNMTNYCSTTVKRTLDVLVLKRTQSSSSSSSFGGHSNAFSFSSVSDAVCFSVGAHSSTVVVSAALPNPEGKDEDQEWVELANTGEREIDLSCLFLDNREDGSKPYRLEDTVLAPRENRRFEQSETGIDLRNSSDEARLLDPQGNTLSLLSWTNAVEGKIYRPSLVASSRLRATARRIIDGDTIEAEYEENLNPPLPSKIRLIGIDAPELDSHDPEKIQIGLKSKEFLSTLIEGKKIELEFDTESTDKYDRLLAYVFTVEDISVEIELIRRGLAIVYTRFPFKKVEEYLSYERAARKAGVGLWGTTNNTSVTLRSQAPVLDSSKAGAGHLEEHILISEIYPNPLSSGTGLLATEWIELFNASENDIDLGGLMMDDAREVGSKPWIFESGTILQSKKFILVKYQDSGLKLNNDYDEVHLISPKGSSFDTLSYEKSRPEVSIARIFRGETLHSQGKICTDALPTPGERNRCSSEERVSQPQVKAVVPKSSSVVSITREKASVLPSLPGWKTKYENVLDEDALSQTGTFLRAVPEAFSDVGTFIMGHPVNAKGIEELQDEIASKVPLDLQLLFIVLAFGSGAVFPLLFFKAFRLFGFFS